jgi:hypothetical protein
MICKRLTFMDRPKEVAARRCLKFLPQRKAFSAVSLLWGCGLAEATDILLFFAPRSSSETDMAGTGA